MIDFGGRAAAAAISISALTTPSFLHFDANTFLPMPLAATISAGQLHAAHILRLAGGRYRAENRRDTSRRLGQRLRYRAIIDDFGAAFADCTDLFRRRYFMLHYADSIIFR